jgi:dihydrofolate reductase
MAILQTLLLLVPLILASSSPFRKELLHKLDLEVSSIDDALALADDDEVMIMGGASFYEQMLPSIDRLYITLHGRPLNLK